MYESIGSKKKTMVNRKNKETKSKYRNEMNKSVSVCVCVCLLCERETCGMTSVGEWGGRVMQVPLLRVLVLVGIVFREFLIPVGK